jgi:hypothetical protein
MLLFAAVARWEGKGARVHAWQSKMPVGQELTGELKYDKRKEKMGHVPLRH